MGPILHFVEAQHFVSQIHCTFCELRKTNFHAVSRAFIAVAVHLAVEIFIAVAVDRDDRDQNFNHSYEKNFAFSKDQNTLRKTLKKLLERHKTGQLTPSRPVEACLTLIFEHTPNPTVQCVLYINGCHEIFCITEPYGKVCVKYSLIYSKNFVAVIAVVAVDRDRDDRDK